MKISQLFKQKKTVLSFEVFPPKQETPIEEIFKSLSLFKEMHPDFISVTYGAGGNIKGRTVEIASKIKNEYNIDSLAHFTCIGQSREDVDFMLQSLEENQLENILALRGDPPIDQQNFDFSKNTFKHASDLIEYIKSKNKFSVSAAAYVEGHIDSLRLKNDIIYLKEKVDKGVDFLITQLFFDNRLFYDFIDKALTYNITCPISAGIMPIFKADQIKTIAAKSGCSLPAKLVLLMDRYQHNAEDMRKAGIEYASIQIQDLINNGVDGIHLYTMNRTKSTQEILLQSGVLRCG